ncbi:MAG: hypothetical protein AAF622_21445, partial [Cyanobacteria bacterium P01_C01_bin.147]
MVLTNDIQPSADAHEPSGTTIFDECALTHTVDALAAIGTGTWTQQSGPGTLTFGMTANDPDQTFTVDAYGTYVFRWTDVNGTCIDFDEITVNFFEDPTLAAAGSDQTICGATSTLLSGNTPTVGTGLWSVITGDGNGSFTNTTSPVSGFAGTAGFVYTLRWTISNGPVCSTSTDDVVVDFAINPVPLISGDSEVCENEVGLVYTTPNVIGNTYNWAITDGMITSGAGSNSITVTWGSAGTGTLQVTETVTSTGCAITTGIFNVTINAIPNFTNLPSSATICSGDQLNFTPTSDVTGTVFTWSSGSPANITGNTDGVG